MRGTVDNNTSNSYDNMAASRAEWDILTKQPTMQGLTIAERSYLEYQYNGCAECFIKYFRKDFLAKLFYMPPGTTPCENYTKALKEFKCQHVEKFDVTLEVTDPVEIDIHHKGYMQLRSELMVCKI